MMLTTAQEEEEVWCECSDDEMYNPCKLKKGTWEPKAEDMLRLFEELKTKKVLELSWKCPGRRPPESDVKKEEEIKQEPVSTPPRQEEKKQAAPSKFDFDDDMNEPKAVLTPRWTPGSTPRPQKKVARMDKVLKDMMQQRKQQAAEREARKLAKSPRAPGSPSRARLGSPASSPRTPPVSQSNRQSPVRSVAPSSEGVMTTPLRAPVDSDSAVGKMTMQMGDIFGPSLSTPQSTAGQFAPSRPSQPGLGQNRTPSQDKSQTPKFRDVTPLQDKSQTPKFRDVTPSQDKSQNPKFRDVTTPVATSSSTPGAASVKPANSLTKPGSGVAGGENVNSSGTGAMDTS